MEATDSPVKPRMASDTRLEDSAGAKCEEVSFWRLALYAVRYFFIVTIVGIGLAVPLVLYRTDKSFGYDDDDENKIAAQIAKQQNNLIFYVFCWLEATWLAACVCHLFSLLFPYVFYFVARYVNSAHRRYWRTFQTLKWPITLVGIAITSFISFRYVGAYHS